MVLILFLTILFISNYIPAIFGPEDLSKVSLSDDK